MPKPRILIVAPNLLYGDPNPRSIRARRLARGLADGGAEVELLTWWSGVERPPERLTGARLTALPCEGLFDARPHEGVEAEGLGPWIETALAELEAGRPLCDRPALVYAIGLPVGAIVAGERIAARLGAPLVADLGDPWPERDDLDLAERARALGAADALVTTTPELAAELRPHLREDAEVLIAPNGGEILRRPQASGGASPGPPLFVHLGAINGGRVDPAPAFAALAELHRAGRIDFHSHTTGFWPGLGELPHPHLPLLDHERALELLARSSAGLILCNRHPAQLPSKAFELACTETWALCVSQLPDDPLLRLLEGSGHAVVARANTTGGVAEAAEEILAREARGERPEPDPRLRWEARVGEIRGLVAELLD